MQPPNKKRKRSIEITRLQPIPFLYCEVCNRKCYDYRTCQNNCIYCSYNCFTVLMLRKLNEEEHNTFEE